MTEYITTGSKDNLDTQINGFPIGEISVITGGVSDMLSIWTDMQHEYNNAYIISHLRNRSILERQLPAEEEYLTTRSLSSVLDEQSIPDDCDSVVIETTQETVIPDEFIKKAINDDFAIIVISPQVSDSLLYSASIIIELSSQIQKKNIIYRIAVRKHLYEPVPEEKVDVSYKPRPRLRRTQHVG